MTKQEKWTQFANEYVVSLFPVFMLPIGLFKKTKQMFGRPAVIGFKIENNQIVWHFKPDNWGQAHFALVKTIKKDPQVLWNIYRQMEILGKKQITLSKTLAKSAPKASNKKLWKIYDSFVKSNIEVYKYGLLLPLLDYQTNTFLSDELTKILKNKKAEKHFNILTQPLRETATKKQDLDLLKILEEIKKIQEMVNIKSLQNSAKGFVAFTGKIIGRANIIYHQDEFEKFKKGDILITTMTHPEFIPIMRMAKAVVTDEGGITCHAAIVAREMKKPCVIGTKIATKIFKDGDMIEVDANKGIVKKL